MTTGHKWKKEFQGKCDTDREQKAREVLHDPKHSYHLIECLPCTDF